MKNKKHQENYQSTTENTYSEAFDNAIFGITGKTFKEKKQKVENQYYRLTDIYYDEFDPVVFKIGVIIFVGLIALAATFLGVAIYHHSELWTMITSIFFGAIGGGLLCFLFAIGLRFLLFENNYYRTKKLYSTVKSLAEESLGLPIKLDYSAGDIMNGCYAVGFAESNAIKEKLNI